MRKHGVAIFANTIKIVAMFIKTIFKDLIQFKRIPNYVLKCNLHLHFLIEQIWLICGEKLLMSTGLKGCVM